MCAPAVASGQPGGLPVSGTSVTASGASRSVPAVDGSFGRGRATAVGGAARACSRSRPDLPVHAGDDARSRFPAYAPPGLD